MSKKLWGYLIRVFVPDGDVSLESFRFEATGISPFKHIVGANLQVMKSEEFDAVKNPMAVANFISAIGDKNTLTVKKNNDLRSSMLKKAYENKETYYGIRLDIASLARISPNLKGDARLNKIFATQSESVALKDATVTNFYSFDNKNNPFDIITFECKSVNFQFE